MTTHEDRAHREADARSDAEYLALLRNQPAADFERYELQDWVARPMPEPAVEDER